MSIHDHGFPFILKETPSTSISRCPQMCLAIVERQCKAQGYSLSLLQSDLYILSHAHSAIRKRDEL